MVIKKLQHDFTNPEQSKRLLELGVPADSANMLWDGYIDYAQRWTLDPYPRYLEYPYSVEIESGSDLYISHVLPCWSVGRLIEIYEICSGKKYERKSARLVREGNVSVMKELTIIEDVIGDIVNARLYIYPHMDFSKLEDN